MTKKYFVGKHSILRKVKIGENSKIWHFCNLFECTIGNNTQIASYCEIRKGAVIGDCCRFQNYIIIGEYSKIGNNVYIGPGVIISNVKYPTARKAIEKRWSPEIVTVENDVVIASGAIILPGLRIGKNALVGAGSVVTKNIPDFAVCYGSPAKIVGDVRDKKYKDLL